MISLSKFTQDILSRSTTKSSRFIVEVFPPAVIAAEFDTSILTFRCDSAELPGRTLTTGENRTYGVPRKVPQGSVYADLNITLICSSTFVEKKFFDEWQNMIQDIETFKFGYIDEYVGEVHITQLNDELNPIYKVIIKDAYPMLVSPMPLNWESQNDLQRTQVAISYRRWISDDSVLDAPKIGDKLLKSVENTTNKLLEKLR